MTGPNVLLLSAAILLVPLAGASTAANAPASGTSRIAADSNRTLGPVIGFRGPYDRFSAPVPGNGVRIGPWPARCAHSVTSLVCSSNISRSVAASAWS